MNYTAHYERLINRAPKIKPLDIYTEGHHIIPRCLGGTDEDGIAYLTPEEHYVAHQLLVKIYPGHSGLIYAASMMTTDRYGSRRNNKLFGWLRRKMTLRKITNETRLKLSEARRARPSKSHTEETRRKISEAKKGKVSNRKGVKLTKETCRKMKETKEANKIARLSKPT